MIRIITDSSCDFDPAMAKQLQVKIIPIHLYFGEKEYIDRVDLSIEEFYQKLATADKLPTTSQITPFQFEQVFAPYVEQGDEIVYISLSSRLSSSVQSAQTAAQKFPQGHIYVVDSLTAALGQHLLLQIAVRLRDQGLPAPEIAAQLTSLAKRTQLLACLKTLKYIQMGGRISAAEAKVGSVLGITPIIIYEDGAPKVSGKVRGHKAACRWMQQYLDKVPADNAYPAVFSHSVNPEGCKELEKTLSPQILGEHLFCDLGATIGTHIGPGAIGVAYIAR